MPFKTVVHCLGEKDSKFKFAPPSVTQLKPMRPCENFQATVGQDVACYIYTWLTQDRHEPCSAFLKSRAERGSHSTVYQLTSGSMTD